MNTRATIIFAVVAVVIAGLYLYFSGKKDKNPHYNWAGTYNIGHKQPYGTGYIEKMLESSHNKTTILRREPVHRALEGKAFTKTDYVLIGPDIFLDTDDISALKNFIHDGNDVFIATMNPPKELLTALYSENGDVSLEYRSEERILVYANFYDTSLHKNRGYDFKYRVGAEDHSYNWNSVDPKVSSDSVVAFQALGFHRSDAVNFLMFNYGPNNGHLYLHTVPLMFTNYFMVKPDKMEYASGVFSYLSGDNLIWDEVSKIPFFSDQKNPYDSPLYYMLQQPALKYAWWMLLIGALLYVVFASKRTQRIIPVLERKNNTSLEFLNVISSLHYQNPDHLDMGRKKMKYFLYFIRSKYGINTQTFTPDHVRRLAEKSKVDIADVQAIHDRYRTIESYAIFNEEPDRLIALYHAIDKFYKTCK